MKINKNIIKELTEYLNEFNLTEIEYTEKDIKVKVSKSIRSNIATVCIPHSLQALITLTAISPLFANRIFLNIITQLSRSYVHIQQVDHLRRKFF